MPRRTRCCQLEQLESRYLLAGDLPLHAGDGAALNETESGDRGGSISGQVLLVANQSCAQHEGAPVESVTLRLLGEQGELLTETQSDTQGSYRFDDLEPGLYAVQQVQPEELQTGKAHLGSGGGIVFESNLIGEIALESGADLSSYDFCEMPLAADPEQSGPIDRPIVPHGKGEVDVEGGAPTRQLVGAAQRFGQLANEQEPSSSQTIMKQDATESEIVLDDKVQTVSSNKNAKPGLGSSQEIKSRPQVEQDQIPEEFWDVLDSIGIGMILSAAEDLPWMGAHDSAPVTPPPSQSENSEQAASADEAREAVPVDEAVDPTHVATHARDAEGGGAGSSEQIR